MSTKAKLTPAQIAENEVAGRIDPEEVKALDTSKAEAPSAANPTVKASKKPKKVRKIGKNYTNAAKKLKEFKKILLPLSEAVKQLKMASFVKFDESFELHINTSEIGVKGEASLPFSNGKQVKVAVADDSLIEKLEKGLIDFDVLVTSPVMMPKLTKFAKLLGPRGLMPSPKSGTIGANPQELIAKFTGNTLRYKTESKTPIVHVLIGKKTNPDSELIANIEAVLRSFPAQSVKSAYICTTMSPSLKIVV